MESGIRRALSRLADLLGSLGRWILLLILLGGLFLNCHLFHL